MAKEMEVTSDFVRKQLICTLPNQMMDVVLKVRTKTGEHTFRELQFQIIVEILLPNQL